MTSTAKTWSGVALILALGFGGFIAKEYQTTAGLRSEWQLAQMQRAERLRLLKENERARAAQIPPAELEALRADHGLVARLRGELDGLKRASAPPVVLPAPTVKALPVAEWRNAGIENPRATFETVLWAATVGEPRTLASALELSFGAKAKASALFASLTDDLRARYESPEQLVALFTARAITANAVTVLSEQGGDEVKSLRVALQTPEGPAKQRSFGFHRQENGWRLVVPESAVDGYAAQLKAPMTSGAK